ncbi:hypothetical protein [Salinisphaera sp. T31B1]|uniref:hypothetical protein n=1 Tax=Salinisphaera sp. T31B1 TaxID=727963 RepID=UPI0033404607
MKNKNVLLGLTIAGLLTGCSAMGHAPGGAGDPPAYVNIARTSEMSVQLVPQIDTAAAPNEHPAAFQPAQLEALLKSLRVVDEQGNEVTLASPSRLAQLASDMSKGFVRAGSRQDVAFAVFRRSGGSVFTASRKVTSGRAFYRDETLNLIFGEFDAEFSEFRDLNISPLKNGSRLGTDGVDTSRLVASASWHRHGDRADWIELPATPAAIEAAAAAAPTAIESSSSGAAQPLQYGPAASSRRAVPPPAEPQGAVSGASASPSPAADGPSRPAAAPPAVTPPPRLGTSSSAAGGDDWSRIEERLTQLKRLRDKNLISAEDYQSKKDALLEQLP